MKKLAICLLFLIPAVVLHSSDFKVKKDFTVSADEEIDYSVVSFGGTIEIEGKVRGSIILIGGEIHLNGIVGEDVVCFASKVHAGPDTGIGGDFIAIGGRLDENTKRYIKGEYFYFRFNLKKIENTLIPILSETKTITFLRTVKIILWFVIALVVLALVPKKITLAERIFKPNVLKIGAIGIFSVFSALSLLLVFIIMSFVIIGIPLLFLLIILYFVIYIFGRTVMLYYIGSKVCSALKLKNVAPVLFIVLGMVVYALLKFLPVAGPFLLIVMNIFEMGIGTAFFLRKKIRFVGYTE